MELLSEIPAMPAQDDVQIYQYELIVWAAEQVRGEFMASSWQAFWMTAIEQRSPADAAAELGVSVGSIYMSRSRVMARIRQKIESVSEREDDCARS